MTGGGCVPLISYLILRSRGEALNPKHTHTLTQSLPHNHMNIHPLPPTDMCAHMLSVLTVTAIHTNFLNSEESCSLICKCKMCFT